MPRRPPLAWARTAALQDLVIETSLGTMGFMNVSSYAPDTEQGGVRLGASQLDLGSIQQRGKQELSSGGVSVRLYTGRVKRGPGGGTRVVLKAYPQDGGKEADAMAANELAAHCSLQPPAVVKEAQHICTLLGGFMPRSGASAGEQWLVFRNDGTTTAAQWAQQASQAGLGGGLFSVFDRGRAERRQAFALEVLRQTLKGLAYMHSRNRLHQSVGPSSVILSGTDETGSRPLLVRLRDLAFSVDVSEAALYGGATLADIWERGRIDAKDPLKQLAAGLWRRAEQEGARTETERRNYGIADDVYAAGLLLACMAFIPFCEPGSIDAPSLQRLLESTFRLDIEAAREYCDADERWAGAVQFLDSAAGGASGWDLLAAMLNPEWRRRPTAESCLNHPFLKEYVANDA
ncbi:hypothetical protein COCSUDRAFT_42575 [Coccomyxa subellipsoidea C-169]|uniref:Protein kinase domain-containing protein n=1 Tax=Coccomyxa subellipsoidea (strain C-169) TaxID=574566 RepID=I0YUY9_COCSC|nr:hypothetical protein COCSUDRAFT_42575 [Coccomyxa subellipsoidea C-169]EIE22208.1 hypothetical protein COCSUDRAFT_42575 [Coccomyxa subellipsoidea C-169]|eukprot:XP_005646752.1 hypothetical protein COCSUDRAFT_42575 [Coccomyxa subellipsoidea C-169]